MKLKYQIAALAASALLAGCSEHDGAVGQSATPSITNEPRESASSLTNTNPAVSQVAVSPTLETNALVTTNETNALLAAAATNAPLATETNAPLVSATTNASTADAR